MLNNTEHAISCGKRYGQVKLMNESETWIELGSEFQNPKDSSILIGS